MPFKKGDMKPPGTGRKKGVKNKTTALKEKMGLKNWEGLMTFIETEGSTKLIREIRKLSGRNYVAAINGLAEFVKPKLTRAEVSGPGGKPIQYESDIDYSKLSEAALIEIANAKRT